MTDKKFWELMKKLNWEKRGDMESIVEPVMQCLSEMSHDELDSFEDKISSLVTSILKIGFQDDECDLFHGYILDTDFLSNYCIAIVNKTHYYQAIRYKNKENDDDLNFETIFYTFDDLFSVNSKRDKDFTFIA